MPLLILNPPIDILHSRQHFMSILKGKMTHTWTHMVEAARSKLLADLVSSGEAEIGDGNSVPLIEAKHVLWLQVSMVYAQRMTVLHCVHNLQEGMLDQGAVP